MSLNGLVHPAREKCESLNWRWVRAHQLAPQGLGPVMSPIRQCDYGQIGPYVSPQVKQQLDAATPYRVWGYPAVTACSRMAPILHYQRRDPNPQQQRGPNCNCGSDNPGWPYGQRN